MGRVTSQRRGVTHLWGEQQVRGNTYTSRGGGNTSVKGKGGTSMGGGKLAKTSLSLDHGLLQNNFAPFSKTAK